MEIHFNKILVFAQFRTLFPISIINPVRVSTTFSKNVAFIDRILREWLKNKENLITIS